MPSPTHSVANLRCSVPPADVTDRGPASRFFDILPNNTDLTEEYLYAHQPTTERTLPVYATNKDPIGRLDDGPELSRTFAVVSGPVIVVARKGYAGRLFVVEDERLIVHEDAYAITPKKAFGDKIDLHWFAGHYSEEFQANRTSFWGIGDFPRERLRGMQIVIPTTAHQEHVAKLYRRRDDLLHSLRTFRSRKEVEIGERIAEFLKSPDEERRLAG